MLSPFLCKSTKRLVAESFASDTAELPRRIAAQPEVYEAIRNAEREAIALAARSGNELQTLSCRSEQHL